MRRIGHSTSQAAVGSIDYVDEGNRCGSNRYSPRQKFQQEPKRPRQCIASVRLMRIVFNQSRNPHVFRKTCSIICEGKESALLCCQASHAKVVRSFRPHLTEVEINLCVVRGERPRTILVQKTRVRHFAKFHAIDQFKLCQCIQPANFLFTGR